MRTIAFSLLLLVALASPAWGTVGIFMETDTTGDTFSTSCAAGTANTTTSSRSATEGGTAGTTAVAVTIDAVVTDLRAIMFSLPVGANENWNAGTWTVRLNVTTAPAPDDTITWVSTFVCRVNSSGVNQATIGSLSAQSISVFTTGVKSMAITGAAQTPAAGDKVYVVLGFTTIDVAETWNFTPNQNIDSPFTAGAGGAAPPMRMLMGVGL